MSATKRRILHPTGRLAALLLLAAVVLSGAFARAQPPSFQPLLLAFDPAQDRLFAAVAAEDRRGAKLLVFPQPGKKGARPGASLDLTGLISGLSYDPDSKTLFVADAHPGALLVFEGAADLDGTRRPDRTIGPEKSGLNGPFALAADLDRGRLYVPNFDGVLVFNLADLAAPPIASRSPGERWRAASRSTPGRSASTSPRR